MYHDLYLGGKALVDKGNVGLDLTKSDLCPSFIEDLTMKVVGLRMADSYTDPFQSRRGGLRAGGEGTSSSLPVECDAYIYGCIDFEFNIKVSKAISETYTTQMTFRNFMYSKIDEDLTFLLKEHSPEFGTSSPFVSINTMLPVTEAKQLVENTADSGDSSCQKQLMNHPKSVAARIKDSKCRTRGRSSKPHVKHRLVQGDLSTRATRAKTVSSKDDSPFLIICDDDEGSCRQCRQSKVSRAVKDDRTDEEECDVLKEREKARNKEWRGEGAQSQSREDVVKKSKVGWLLVHEIPPEKNNIINIRAVDHNMK
uniref:Uncharacterized protein n=1 Tax=Tanacetum cinerariifolium TaxID=118510 RepID=A0A6L2KRB2_TANCI|nr:hypothetical protein [Tanacetum cinerariifolium]